jgi:hypothetical protein
MAFSLPQTKTYHRLPDEHDLVGDVRARGLVDDTGDDDDDDDLWLVEWRAQVRRYADVRKLRLTEHKSDVLVAVGDGGDVTKQTANDILQVLMETDESGKRRYNGVLLQSDIGSGKSRVLSYLHQYLTSRGPRPSGDPSGKPSGVVTKQQAMPSLHPDRDMVLCVVGNPFERGLLARPCGVWVDAVNVLIDRTLLRLHADELARIDSSCQTHSRDSPATAAAGVSTPTRKPHTKQTSRWRSKHQGDSENRSNDGNVAASHRARHDASVYPNGVPILESAVWGKDAALLPIHGAKDSAMAMKPRVTTQPTSTSTSTSTETDMYSSRALRRARKELLSDPNARRQVVERWLEHVHPLSGVHAHVHLLNEPLGINLEPFDGGESSGPDSRDVDARADKSLPRKPSMESSSSSSPEDVQSRELVSVVVELFRGVVACLNDQGTGGDRTANALYVLVDDAMHLDVASLRITRALADAPFVRLVMASRPVDDHSFPVAKARRICQTLADLPTVHVMHMPRLSNTQVGALARSKLGVLSIPKEIEAALCIKSRGNPLIVLEMVNNMVSAL